MKLPGPRVSIAVTVGLLAFVAGIYKLDLDHSNQMKQEYSGLTSELESTVEDMQNSIINKNDFLAKNLFSGTPIDSQLAEDLEKMKSLKIDHALSIRELSD